MDRATIRAAEATKYYPVAMQKGPVQRIVEGAMNAYENMRGLNIGGAESGRIAKAKALKKYKKTNP